MGEEIPRLEPRICCWGGGNLSSHLGPTFVNSNGVYFKN